MVGPHTKINTYPPTGVVNIPIEGHCVRRRKHIVLIVVKGYN
jgi:hypothetical protein